MTIPSSLQDLWSRAKKLLPRVPVPQNPPSLADKYREMLLTPKPVLFVEDDEMVAPLLMRLQQRWLIEPVVAKNSTEALDFYSQRPRDWAVCVIDLRLGPKSEFDGLQVFQLIRDINPAQPCCVISGQLTDSDSEEIHKVGAAVIMTKPVDLQAEYIGNLFPTYGIRHRHPPPLRPVRFNPTQTQSYDRASPAT